jgi:hypothetical protein
MELGAQILWYHEIHWNTGETLCIERMQETMMIVMLKGRDVYVQRWPYFAPRY